MSLSDIIRVPFGYLLEWLYLLTHNYGVALILFGVIVKLVLLPVKSFLCHFQFKFTKILGKSTQICRKVC